MSIRKAILAVAPVLALVALTGATSAGGASQARGTFVDVDGNTVGWVKLHEDGTGVVHVNVHVKGLVPGKHGIHIHGVGTCSPTFAAAGPHYNPHGHQHGLLNPLGSHAGDLPNLVVNPAGVGKLVGKTDGVTITPGPVDALRLDARAPSGARSSSISTRTTS